MLHKEEMTRSSCREELARSIAKNKKSTHMKPSHLSRRSVSLPTDLQNTNVKTKTLFWFIPKDHRRQRRSTRRSNDCPIYENPGSDIELQFEKHQQRSPLCLEIPEKVALEWIRTTSIHSFSDHSTSDQSEGFYDYDDDLDGPLLGLKFVES